MNATQVSSVATGAVSHVGAVRRQNEDAFSARADLGLWIVADGMGGPAAGEVASTLVISEVEARIAAGEGLVDAIRAAHGAILAAPGEGRGTAGMGSTVVALRLRVDSYEVAWVGDSRAYLFREGRLHQLTRDHSLVQEMLDRSEITPAQARRHPQRNIITQALGGLGTATPVPDRVSGVAHKDDVFLLCSDGLNGELGEVQIKTLLSDAEGPEHTAQQLVEAALSAGGRDNITAVVVAIV
jgi:serine/threonine protein phosphatase PrpC